MRNLDWGRIVAVALGVIILIAGIVFFLMVRLA